MKRIIGFVVGTAAIIAVAIGVQANAGSSDEDKHPPAVSETTPTTPQTPAPSSSAPSESQDTPAPQSAAPGDEPTEAPSGTSDEKTDDGDRDGFTEDHTGKPGENK